jgi:hypothetical protein
MDKKKKNPLLVLAEPNLLTTVRRTSAGQRPYHLEQEAALVNLLVAGELLRHRVADAGEAPRRDHLRRTAKHERTKKEKRIKKQEWGPWCEAGVAGAGADTASTPCSPATHRPSVLHLSLLSLHLPLPLPWRPSSNSARTSPRSTPPSAAHAQLVRSLGICGRITRCTGRRGDGIPCGRSYSGGWLVDPSSHRQVGQGKLTLSDRTARQSSSCRRN